MILILHVFIGAMILCFMLPYIFKSKIGWAGCIFWTYCLASAAWVSFSPLYIPDWYLHPLFQMNAKMMAMQALFLMAVIPPIAFSYGEAYEKQIFNLIKFIIVADSILIIYQGYGIGNVGTLDAGVIAACLPLFVDFKKKSNNFGLVICLLALIKAKSATSALVILALLAYHAFIYFGAFTSFTVVTLGISASYLYQGQHFLTGAGRVQGWKNYLTWLFNLGPWATGTGLGTFSAIAPYLDNGNNNMWLYMHSDWLEILFDGGVIGLILAAIFYVDLLRKTKNTILFSCILGFGVCCMTYSPLHMTVVFQFIFAFLVASACRHITR